jgi:hypothetical protein
LQVLAVVADGGVLVEARNRVADDSEPVERLEDGVVLIAPTAHLKLCAVGLRERELFSVERGRHDKFLLCC